jgi:ribosome biogenesis GTPase
MIVDNPGMREVHLWLAESSLEDAFEDIAELALTCRFSDCRHETEPGCAVREALDSGELSQERWESYRAFEREAAELAERIERRERSRARRKPDAGAS